MQSVQLLIAYTDGTELSVQSDQRDARTFEEWALRRKIFPPAGQSLSEIMQVTYFRVCAWSAQQRETGQLVEWADWDKSVIAVQIGEVAATDPTRPGTSEGSSPS